MPKLISCPGDQLHEAHRHQVNETSRHEFNVSLPPRHAMADRLYFLLLEGDVLLASGFLRRVSPVLLAKDAFSILNIGGLISNIKGRGYGREIVLAIRGHLATTGDTGLGFCFPRAQGFYEKCGLKVETSSTHRFVCIRGEERHKEQEGQYIVYQDGKDQFMAKVLANPTVEVLVPDPAMW